MSPRRCAADWRRTVSRRRPQPPAGNQRLTSCPASLGPPSPTQTMTLKKKQRHLLYGYGVRHSKADAAAP